MTTYNQTTQDRVNKFLIKEGLMQEAPPVLSGWDVATGTGRSIGQGVLLGFGDELEAMVRSIGDRSYDEIVAEIRGEIKEFEKQYPATAITTEIIGAIAPTALLYLSGVGAPAAVANTANIEGAVYAVGKGEEGIAEDIKNAPSGAAWGLGGTVIGMPILHGLGVVGQVIWNKVREKGGDKYANIVIKQLSDMVTQTGKSIAEIVTDVQAGRLFAENKTLSHALSTLFSGGGEVKKQLTDLTQTRAKHTRLELKDTINKAIRPESEDADTAFAGYMKGQAGVQEGSSELYQKAWRSGDDLPVDVVDEVMESLRRVPNGQQVLADINQAAGNIVPFFDFDDAGRLIMIKKPTLKDAENVYRNLRDLRTGNSAADNHIHRQAEKLKEALNKVSPDLQEARLGWQILKTNEEAFALGSKSLSKNVDEVRWHFDKLMSEAQSTNKEVARIAIEKLKAFRTGVLHAVNNKLTNKGGASAIAGDSDTKLPAIIRIVFPKDSIEDIVRKADIAESAQVIKNTVTAGGQGGGSPTAGRLQELARQASLGIGSNTGEGAASQLVMRMVNLAAQKLAPQMDDQARMQIAKIVFSENPRLVKDALTNKSNMSALQQKISEAFTKFGAMVVPATTTGTSDTRFAQGILGQINLAH